MIHSPWSLAPHLQTLAVITVGNWACALRNGCWSEGQEQQQHYSHAVCGGHHRLWDDPPSQPAPPSQGSPSSLLIPPALLRAESHKSTSACTPAKHCVPSTVFAGQTHIGSPAGAVMVRVLVHIMHRSTYLQHCYSGFPHTHRLFSDVLTTHLS